MVRQVGGKVGRQGSEQREGRSAGRRAGGQQADGWAGRQTGAQAGRKECRQAGLYIAIFKPAEGQLQKLVKVNKDLIKARQIKSSPELNTAQSELLL